MKHIALATTLAGSVASDATETQAECIRELRTRAGDSPVAHGPDLDFAVGTALDRNTRLTTECGTGECRVVWEWLDTKDGSTVAATMVQVEAQLGANQSECGVRKIDVRCDPSLNSLGLCPRAR